MLRADIKAYERSGEAVPIGNGMKLVILGSTMLRTLVPFLGTEGFSMTLGALALCRGQHTIISQH
jgi:hypothetical protein